ncbi:hypothetical protein [Clostridium botulinum]|uniref:hypothetical protein n=1 Tax=Clostridium botulinum TaxID=1491 RepID=UPI0019672027|nr:hypothetical protein [Clostridium botulinum]MBN1059358.1 hypothetical protein [Clostridium botulinum]
MTLSEILKPENNNKIFICVANGTKVRNDGRTLLYLNKNFDDGTQNWSKCIVSHVWEDSEYELLDNNGQDDSEIKIKNYLKLKRIYELILHYEEEYGQKIALETIEVSNQIRIITTIDELLEDLENDK